MRKRDSIFWAASAVLLIAVVLALAVDSAYLLLGIGAYLLRPTLHSLGLFKELVDEREMQVQYRASNVGFTALVIGSVVLILYLMGRNDHAWELVLCVLLAGVAVRALARLLMDGDLAVAGPRIVMAIGLLLCLFGVLEGGLSADALVHGIPGLAVIGLGLVARRYPRPVGAILAVVVAMLAYGIVSSALAAGANPWGTPFALALIAAPTAVAAYCLLKAKAQPGESKAPRAAGVAILVASLAATSVAGTSLGAQPQGLTCHAWRDNPSLGKLCSMAHDDTVIGRRIPAGTMLRYDTTGALIYIWFKHDFTLDGLELRGGDDGPHHTFYPDGKPKMLWLARTQDVQGVPCRPMNFWTEIIRHTSAVYFHPGGRLKSCRLGRAATINGVTYAKGDRVEF